MKEVRTGGDEIQIDYTGKLNSRIFLKQAGMAQVSAICKAQK